MNSAFTTTYSLSSDVVNDVEVIQHEVVSTALDTVDCERWNSLNAMPNQTAVIDPRGIVRWVNTSWEQDSRARWSRPSDAVGASYVSLCRNAMGFSREATTRLADGLRNVLAGAPSFEIELPRHPEGAEAWFTVTITPCSFEGKRGAMVQQAEVTDLHQANRRRSIARSVARVMEREESRRELLRDVMIRTCDTMGWSLAALWSWDHSDKVLRCESAYSQIPGGGRGWATLTNSAGLAARVWATQGTQWSEGIEREDGAVARTVLSPQAPVPVEAIGMPVGQGGQSDGVVVFYSPHRHRPDAATLQMLSSLMLGATWMPASTHTDTTSRNETRPSVDSKGSMIDLAAMSVCPVLITGETGSGKARMAREIHARSDRSRGAIVECNCASFTAGAFDDELFGHDVGGVPGTTRARRGLLEEAHGGTLVLRNIGALDPACQAKLLNVLETHSFRRLGGAKDIQCDVRVIATSSTDLRSSKGRWGFSQDLLMRISSLAVSVAPLRQRSNEISTIAQTILNELARAYHRPAPKLSHEGEQLLAAESWEGNVRELRNVLERSWLGVGQEISAASVAAGLESLHHAATMKALEAEARETDLKQPGFDSDDDDSDHERNDSEAPIAQHSGRHTPRSAPEGLFTQLGFDPECTTLAAFERALIERVMKHTSYNMRRAATILGISRSTLYLRAKAYQLDVTSARRGGKPSRRRLSIAADNDNSADVEAMEEATGT
jgi:DNA-binding NtrC family response regulator